MTDLAALLSLSSTDAVVTVDASGMADAKLAVVVIYLSKVDFLVNVGVTNALDGGQLEAMLRNSTTVVVNATDMDASKLNVLAQYTGKIADQGILGTLRLSASVNNLAGLLGKVRVEERAHDRLRKGDRRIREARMSLRCRRASAARRP